MDYSEYGLTKDQLSIFAALLIRNDCATIKAAMKSEEHSIIQIGLMPYTALSCCSLSEYFGEGCFGKNGQLLSFLREIRNSLKLWQNGFSSVAKDFKQIDCSQDMLYRDMLRFEFTKPLNIHYNLGVYFDQNDKVVGNTQLLAHMLGLDSLSEEENKEKAYKIGKQAASIIGSVHTALSNELGEIHPILLDKEIGVRFCDLNTNTSRVFFKEYPKDISLYMLHLLSLAGFAKHIIVAVLPISNPWVMRIVYVTAHYCFVGLKRLCSSMKMNLPTIYQRIASSLEELLRLGEPLVCSTFRGCMMHYDLFDKKTGKFLISKEYFDVNKPMFGLVESCFAEETYHTLINKLINYLEAIETFLMEQFDFKKACIRDLDDN